MGRRRAYKKLDPMSRYLMAQGAYSLKKSDNAIDKMLLKALKKSEDRIYRFWLGVFYAFGLMLSLYWLPLFGPMIAGYIGGKRAGSPTKGVIAGLIVVGIFYVVSAPDMLARMPVDVMAARDSFVATSVARFPWMEPLMAFVVSYTTPTVTLLSGRISYTPQTYTILLVFSYIGGTIAKQRREEIRLLVLGRMASSLPVQNIAAPMPHHSAAPVQTESPYSFERYVPVGADPEFKQIYREEFRESKPRRARRKTEKPAKTRKSMKKEELIKSASHSRQRTHRHGFL